MLLKSSRSALVAALIATASLIAPTAADAGWRYRGGHYGGYYGGPYGGYHGGYYPAYGYGRPYGYHYRKRRSNKGAIIAALIGGVALGAILASTQRSYGRSCVVRQRAYTRSGRPYLRRVRVC
jgi:hypothetical protein